MPHIIPNVNLPHMTNNEIMKMFTDSGQKFETETIDTKDGHQLTVLFFEHSSLALVWNGFVVYNDPLLEYADYSKLPKADLILVTHEHYDHLDKAAVEHLRKTGTVVAGSAAVGREVSYAEIIPHFSPQRLTPEITVESVPAYNVSPAQLQFHPRERGDNGYVVSFGGTRVYIAGDTEPIPEMGRLKDIDIMFLPVNQPYTMTPQQAAEAARTIGAPIFFPYHTTDTDTDLIARELADTPSISVRIHNMP